MVQPLNSDQSLELYGYGPVDVFLQTDRLILRWFTADDLQLVIELDSDPQVKRYIDNGAPVDRADVVDTL